LHLTVVGRPDFTLFGQNFKHTTGCVLANKLQNTHDRFVSFLLGDFASGSEAVEDENSERTLPN